MWKPQRPMPDEALVQSPPIYGIPNFCADLFTDRQLVALTTFSDLVAEARERIQPMPWPLVCRTMGRHCGTAASERMRTPRRWGCIWHLQWIVWQHFLQQSHFGVQLEARLSLPFREDKHTYDLGLPRVQPFCWSQPATTAISVLAV